MVKTGFCLAAVLFAASTFCGSLAADASSTGTSTIFQFYGLQDHVCSVHHCLM